ncbi:glycosyltransferase family 1 protein [Pedobacter sp. D749]|uniref:glycosyltransferase family 4 protein n=1 Tax=Pedobacter sp. D749 TaxID=2856523 RepID=UPI001C59AFDE|nr:glycosyltransferase family 1 protein [Pedobacter sp. D749]QXU42340.1 glycosyltransferase family 4 protein [Pedobacter sp. D749]
MDKPFKVGIWINEDDLPEVGGGFSYTQRLVQAINEKKNSDNLEVVFIGYNLKGHYKKNSINLNNRENFFYRKMLNFFHKYFSINLKNKYLKRNNINNIDQLNKSGIELIFYPNPYVQIANFPYIMTLWDLGHKSTYSFPELNANDEYEQRDYSLNKTLNKAIFICCESKAGKEELVKYYNINEQQIRILPMFPSIIVESVISSEKPKWISFERFFLYPAQFWPHKNHYNLLLAFQKFIREKPDVKLVLTGSDKGNLNYISKLIGDLRIEKNVIITGFVRNENLKWLYLHSNGLVFPSFLGPTNMPLLEAFYLGCNIACSQLNGHVELLSQNAIYFDPLSPDSIKNSMDKLLKMNKKTDNVFFQMDSIVSKLEEILEDSISVRKTWGQTYN